MSDLIDRAREFATEAHAGQTRKFGDRPYVYHPEQVYRYLAARHPLDDTLLAAAWLHDVVEDCGVPARKLGDLFGPDVARLVLEASHPETPEGLPRRERWPIYLDWYARASEPGRILKLADRLCNLREYVNFWDQVPDRERRFIRGVYRDETLQLAERLWSADMQTAALIVDSINELAPLKDKAES